MFCVSIVLIIMSSYLIMRSLKWCSRGGSAAFLYFLLICFSQIVLSFEVLSLFKAISVKGFLICNAVFFMISVMLNLGTYCFELFSLSLRQREQPELLSLLGRGLRIFCCKPLKPVRNDSRNEEQELKKILSALKRDKALMFLSVCFILFCIFQLAAIFIFPVSFGDALAYYLPRCTMWLQQGSIAHYITPDARELIMPVNMEFLYTWLLMFRKDETGAAVFSFIGYTGTIYVIYNLLKELGFKIRRCLWAVFVFSSFALVIIETRVPCADLFIGGLILGSIYLFIKSLKYNDKTALYFSALSYALAAGAKTTALIAIPSVFIIFCALCRIYRSKDTALLNLFQHLIIFCAFFILNFLIFSSYNYILNYIDCGNFISRPAQFLVNQFTDGIKGYAANLIKYFFMLFDMSGMPSFIDINGLVEYWQGLILKFIGADVKTGSSNYFPWLFVFHNRMHILNTALGAMGLFVFAPSVIYAVKRVFRKKSKTALIMGLLAASIIFNVLLFARTMIFTGGNMRYILTFIVIASPVIAYSYPVKNHKFCKVFLCLIMFIYLVINTQFKPIAYILDCLHQHKIYKMKTDFEETKVHNYIAAKNPKAIALMTAQAKEPSYHIETLRFKDIKVYKILAENIEDYDLSKYDYIITDNYKVSASNILKFEERMKNPRSFVSKCIYNDKKQNTIYPSGRQDKRKLPVIIECEVPFDYFKSQGFIKDEKYKGEDYVILYKKYTLSP